MVNKRGLEGARAGAWRVRKFLFRVLRIARRGFLCVYGVLDDEGHGVMLVLTLRHLQRYLFVYLSCKFLPPRFTAFRRVLFALGISYAI